MCKTVLKGGVIGGIVSFLWYSISWMLLPWHTTTLMQFKNESAIAQAISANAPASGMYFMPMQQPAINSNVPQIFAAIHLERMPSSMTSAIIIGLIAQIVIASLATWLLCKTKGLTYWGRVKFIFVFALAAAILSEISYWNWFNFSSSFTLVQIADVIIAWFFAGLAIAKFANNP
jgi:hypothetical protein